MSRVGHNPEIIIPEGYDVSHVVADNPQMSAMMAYDRAAEETVFLKLRNPQQDKHAASRILNEADIRADLVHPQIPGFRAADPEADHPYIVTEFRRSDPTVMRRFKQFGDPELAAELGVSMLNVLDYVHARKVVHCDIKPGNWLFEWEKADLTDFDISRRLDGGVDILGRDNGEDGPAKTTIGTLEYMSPEQLSSDMPVDERSDIYSMGQMLLHILSGRKPASVLDRIKALEKDGPSEHDPIGYWGRDVPAALLDIADKALQLMPEDRYQSASEMSEDLEYYLHPAESLALAA